MNCFINEDRRDETGKYFFCEPGEIADQETTFQGHHTKQNDHDPEADPTAPREEFQFINVTKLKENKTPSWNSTKKRLCLVELLP